MQRHALGAELAGASVNVMLLMKPHFFDFNTKRLLQGFREVIRRDSYKTRITICLRKSPACPVRKMKGNGECPFKLDPLTS